ncbi:hypothetical protein TNCV_2180181 [Trichonephila clavipes]|uniref:Uncharacterized protein n=1 Tax=Trichonephila clavipes TaxID=2585209 RepID=A0A8X7B9E3_TRICX|nr:hypothetical protein TNCV_2180181 [Trichonephila clavipes]
MPPEELHQLKYEVISVPQGSVALVKKTQERKSSTCYLLITKGVEFEPSTTKDPPCRGEMLVKSIESSNVLLLERCGSKKRLHSLSVVLVT